MNRYTNKGKSIEDPIILTGVYRSGTTLLSTIMATFDNIEYEYQPGILDKIWPLESNAPQEVAQYILKTGITDMLIHHILGRNINLRRTDGSVKTRFISKKKIEARWRLKDTKDAMSHIARHRSRLLIKSPNQQPLLELFYKSFQNIQIVHIIRNPFDAALSMEKEKFYDSDFLAYQTNLFPTKKTVCDGKEYFIPWYIPDNELKKFARYNPYTRSLMCWNRLMESCEKLKKRSFVTKRNYVEVSYEQLLANGEEAMKELARFLGRQTTEKTRKEIKKIKKDNLYRNRNYRLGELPHEEIVRARKLMKQFGIKAATNEAR